MTEYIKPEIIDDSPYADTVKDAIHKTDLNVDHIYWSLNDLLTQIPDFAEPDLYYKLDGTYPLTASFAAGGYKLRAVGEPLEDDDATTQGWCNSQFLPLVGGTVTGLITCDDEPTDAYHLANKAYVDTHGGGGGDAVWGSIGGDITSQADLMTQLNGKAATDHPHTNASESVSGFMPASDKIKLNNMVDPALYEAFIDFSSGVADKGKPIKLDEDGVLDSSFFSIRIFNLVGDFTPTAGTEYPSPAEPGDYWIIEGVGDIVSGGYTFTSGALDGKTIYDNELMVKGRDDKWGIIHMKVDPGLYYKLDGTNALTANFAGGGHKLVNIANGVNLLDAVNFSQLDLKLDKTGKAADSNKLDGLDKGSFELYLGSPLTSGYVLSSTSAGVRSWVPPATGGGEAIWGTITGNIVSQTDLMAEFDKKAESVHTHSGYVSTSGDTMTGDLEISKSTPTLKFLHEGQAEHWWLLGTATNFQIQHRSGPGAYINAPLTIDLVHTVPKLRGGTDKWTIDGSQVWTDDYHPSSGAEWGHIGGDIESQVDLKARLDFKLDITGTAANSEKLDSYTASAFAKISEANFFQQKNVRTHIGGDGFVTWDTYYDDKSIYVGTAQHPTLGWGNYVSSVLGQAPGASKRTLRVVSTVSSDSDGVDDLGTVNEPWKELFANTSLYTLADQTELRSVASISNVDADFLLSLTPKAFEIVPKGIVDHPFLADIPAPAKVKTRLGFVAQEVEAAMVSAGYDPETYALTTGPAGRKFISQTELIPLLVKKIQDLETRLSILEAP